MKEQETETKKISDVIKSPKTWAKNTFARNENGYAVSPSSPNAHSFSLLGAIYRIDREHANEYVKKIDDYLEQKGYKDGLITWNDDTNTTYEKVKQLLNDLNL